MDNNREKKIVRASGVGIAGNALLAALKVVVGLAAGSVAIVMDAVNNLSDTLSSVITIVGTKLAGRRPTKKHPFGFGRIEYLTTILIAFLVLMAGIAALEQSVKAIIGVDAVVGNEPANYDLWAFVIMTSAIVVKLLLSQYTKKVGRDTGSDALLASSKDAFFDSLITASTLVSALLMVIWDIDVDGWLGAAISVIIIKNGLEMITDMLNKLLGERITREQSIELKRLVCEYPEVKGAYDLTLHSYGPNHWLGSVNIEIDDDLNARDIFLLTRRMQTEIFVKAHVYLTFGIYAIHNEGVAHDMHIRVVDELKKEKDVLQVHGFYADIDNKMMNFDVVISFDVRDQDAYQAMLTEKIRALYPDFAAYINIDHDISD